ncbi:hypothetical protein V6N12_072046 [Hibiscus sabdariffa]|uniref:Uncharacterized protein n=1 Tax=Hibiscus sabdariffa TaxID=183260 RepID=A0ABR2FLM0_9ROSI
MAGKAIKAVRNQRPRLQSADCSVCRLDPFTLDNVQKHAGKISFCWTGTRPRLIIKDPELIKVVLANMEGDDSDILRKLLEVAMKGRKSFNCKREEHVMKTGQERAVDLLGMLR